MSFGEKFEDTMMTIAEVVGDNKYLMAIKDAFTRSCRSSSSAPWAPCSRS